MFYFGIIMTFFSLSSWGAVTVGSCPDAFEGRVKEVIEEVGESSLYSVQKVIFTNLQTLRGDVKDQVLIDMLSNGPFEIVQDEEYRVQLQNGKLCWIEKI